MNCKNLLFFIIVCCAVYAVSILGSSCAQIGAPTGGPRDSIPPKLLNANPPNGTTNFKGNRITLTYDEYVQIQKLQENLLVSPTPKITPNIDYKLKTVTIKIRDTLEPNTTYRFDMGNAIQDINEGNPVKHFSFIFSTGSYIDSLQFSGNVQLAETGKPDSTLLVFLYKDLDDSAVIKTKPRYITRLDSSGNFTFHNLPGGIYNVFALKDEGGQKIYNHPDELFAFADSTVKVSDSTKPVKLFAYTEEKPKPKSSSGKSTSAEKKLKYTTSIDNGRQDLLTPITIEFNRKLKNFDSLKIELTDTLFNPYKETVVSIDTTGKKITVANKWMDNADYRLIIPKDFATDTLGVALLKSDTIHFKTKKEGEYGTIIINFKNLEKFKNPVLQFISNNEVVNSYPLTSAKWSVKLFKPGSYEIRILEDDNKNGIWDPGNYHLKLQPEKVFAIKQKIDIRQDWDNEKDVVL
ncbi:MAG TPA: Ig-like domain-containing domain [Ginsengibacter sp.]